MSNLLINLVVVVLAANVLIIGVMLGLAFRPAIRPEPAPMTAAHIKKLFSL